MKQQGRETMWAIGCVCLEPREGGWDHTHGTSVPKYKSERGGNGKRLMRKCRSIGGRKSGKGVS